MPKLPQIKARDLIRIVEKLGFVFRSQSGSHKVFVHPDGRRTTIPIHPTQAIGIGLLTKIIKKDLQIDKDEFIDLLKK
jgi:predicted RNA binding protein YcfA (HicA-like mRNA interferase family)